MMRLNLKIRLVALLLVFLVFFNPQEHLLGGIAQLVKGPEHPGGLVLPPDAEQVHRDSTGSDQETHPNLTSINRISFNQTLPTHLHGLTYRGRKTRKVQMRRKTMGMPRVILIGLGMSGLV